jgi:serine acetyltransferase
MFAMSGSLRNTQIERTGDQPHDLEPRDAGSSGEIGAAATILPGVTIGADSVVAAGAVVTHDAPPATLVAGVPATVIRDI